MKSKIDKNCVKIGITSFLVIAASICFFYLVFHGSNVAKGFSRFFKICMPVIDGFIIAYIMTPLMNLNERSIVKPLFLMRHKRLDENSKRKMRCFSILMTVVIVLLMIILFSAVIIPQIFVSIQNFVMQFPTYIDNLEILTENVLKENPELEKKITELLNQYSNQLDNFMDKTIMPQFNDMIRSLSKGVLSFFSAFWNFFIGFIISIYVMASKEKFAAQAKKIAYAIWDTERANKLINGIRYTHLTFIGFLFGKVVDSIIIGIITFICTSLIGTPYAILVSTIVGITNIIPFFGPYFGAVGGAILIVLVDPLQSLYFILLILVIQQFDGNFLGPMILGGSTGLSGFWVIFSITIFGGLFGVAGMIIGVPLFAVIYAGIRSITNKELERRKLPTDTGVYMNVGTIDEKGDFTVYDQKAYRKQIGRESNWARMEKSFRNIFRHKKEEESNNDDGNYKINLALPSSFTPDTIEEIKNQQHIDDDTNDTNDTNNTNNTNNSNDNSNE